MTKQFPTDSRCTFILCDAIRQEAGGKVSLLGVFANGEIVSAPGVSLPTSMPLAFYFLFIDGVGRFDLKIDVMTPSHKLLVDGPVNPVEKLANKNLTVAIQLPLVDLAEAGQYTFTVKLDSQTYTRPFTLTLS